MTAASGRHVRLGTASMLTEPNGPFIDISKINLGKYAHRPALAKVRVSSVLNDYRNVPSTIGRSAWESVLMMVGMLMKMKGVNDTGVVLCSLV